MNSKLALTVTCQYCGAPAGSACRGRKLKWVGPHAIRIRDGKHLDAPRVVTTPKPRVRLAPGLDPHRVRKREDRGLSFFMTDGPDEHEAWLVAVAAVPKDWLAKSCAETNRKNREAQ